MPLRIGTSAIAGAYIGADPISRVYVGADMVFQAEAPPSGPTMEPVLFDSASMVTITKPSTDSSWEDVDVSTTVPSGATGVLILVQKTTLTDVSFGVRKNGSTQSFVASQDMDQRRNEVYAVGLDGNRIFEAYCSLWAEITAFKILGYYNSTVFPDPMPSIAAPVAKDIWYDRDLSGTTGANPNAVVINIGTSAIPTRIMTARPDGSANALWAGQRNRCHAILAAPSGVIEVHGAVAISTLTAYIVAYASEGHDMLVNEVDVTPVSNSTWTEDDLGAGGLAGIYRIESSSATTIDFRTPGSASIGAAAPGYTSFLMCKASANKVEIWTASTTGGKIYRVGKLVGLSA